MSSPSIPVLLFPQGSETVSTKIIEIKWKEATVFNGVNEATLFYEVLFQYDYSNFSDNDEWVSIARVSSDTFTYRWVIPEFLFGSKIIIAIRSISLNGNYSDYSRSGVFSISQKSLPKPSISNPVANEKYGSSIQININNNFNIEDAKKLNRYRLNLYYSSDTSGISLAPIYEKISGATSKITWDVSKLVPAQDYTLYAYYTDDYGNKGPQVFVGPFSIENQGYFIIDTDGPEVAVKINSDDGYARERNVSLEIYASDNVSDIHSYYIRQDLRTRTSGGDFILEQASVTESRTYRKDNFIRLGKYLPGSLEEEEGRYVVSALVQDLAGNRSDEKGESIVKKRNKTRSLYEKNGYKFTAWTKDSDSLYVCMYNGSESEVIKVSFGSVSVVSKFDELIVAVTLKGNRLYASRFNDKRSFDLVFIEATGLSDIASSDIPDTQISAIGDSGDGGVLAGCIDGKVFRILNDQVFFIYDIGSPVYAIDAIDSRRSFILGQTSDKVFIYNNGNVVKSTINI